MADEFQFDVFLSHSAKDKPVVRELATRLKQDGVRVWFDEEQIKPGDSIPAKIEEGLERSRVLVLCMSANAFGSDWAALEAGTFRFRDPLNQERRFIPLRLDDAPIKGSLAQFLYINWHLTDREQEYAKLLEACRHPTTWPAEEAALRSIETGTPPKMVSTVGDHSIKLEVTASLALENTDTWHGLFTIKALNLGSKVARIRRVAVVLMPDELIKGSTIVPVSSELNIGQKQAVVKIEGDEDMHEWQQVLRFKPNFKVHEKEGERYGKGYIELTSGKRVEFEFLLLPDSAWDLLTAPIAPVFDGKVGHKCSHCGFIFLSQADLITVTCPKCKNVDHLKPKPSTAILAKQQEKIAMAASAIRRGYLKIIGSYEDCTVLIEDKNMEKLRARQRAFQNDVNQFWKTFELNKVYLPQNVENDVRVIVNTCIQYVRTCDRVQTLIDSKPTGNGQKMVDAQYLQIEKLEDGINAMRPKIEAHFRRLIAGQ